MPDNDLAAAVERLRMLSAGETVPAYYDTDSCFAVWKVYQDREIFSNAYLAWTDPTPLTLDVLRRELGEPTRGGADAATADAAWLVSKPIADRWVNWGCECCWMKGVGYIRTLGQLRRILSVIQETTPGGGDAET